MHALKKKKGCRNMVKIYPKSSCFTKIATGMVKAAVKQEVTAQSNKYLAFIHEYQNG